MASESPAAIIASTAPEITRDELLRRLRDPSLIIVDARYRDVYQDEHLPRAINLPVAEVDELASKLLPNKDAEIAVYCASFT
jgi:rhodanese-related sulfurtransferase